MQPPNIQLAIFNKAGVTSPKFNTRLGCTASEPLAITHEFAGRQTPRRLSSQLPGSQGERVSGLGLMLTPFQGLLRSQKWGSADHGKGPDGTVGSLRGGLKLVFQIAKGKYSNKERCVWKSSTIKGRKKITDRTAPLKGLSLILS